MKCKIWCVNFVLPFLAAMWKQFCAGFHY